MVMGWTIVMVWTIIMMFFMPEGVVPVIEPNIFIRILEIGVGYFIIGYSVKLLKQDIYSWARITPQDKRKYVFYMAMIAMFLIVIGILGMVTFWR